MNLKHWVFNEADNTISPIQNQNYRIPLEEFDSCASILDWIAHMADKTGVTDEMLGELVRLFSDIFPLHGRTEKEIDPIARVKSWIEEIKNPRFVPDYRKTDTID